MDIFFRKCSSFFFEDSLCSNKTFLYEIIESDNIAFSCTHRSVREADMPITSMKKYYIISPASHATYLKTLLEVHLLTEIYSVDDFCWIPSVSETILDRAYISS